MIDDEMKDNIVNNGDTFSQWRETTSHRANTNEAVFLFSLLLIVASLLILQPCKKMATQRPNVA